MFFVTSVSKSERIVLSQNLCLRIASQQIIFHKKLLKLPKDELNKIIPKTQSTRKMKDRTYNIYMHLIQANESDIIGLVKRY